MSWRAVSKAQTRKSILVVSGILLVALGVTVVEGPLRTLGDQSGLQILAVLNVGIFSSVIYLAMTGRRGRKVGINLLFVLCYLDAVRRLLRGDKPLKRAEMPRLNCIGSGKQIELVPDAKSTKHADPNVLKLAGRLKGRLMVASEATRPQMEDCNAAVGEFALAFVLRNLDEKLFPRRSAKELYQMHALHADGLPLRATGDEARVSALIRQLGFDRARSASSTDASAVRKYKLFVGSVVSEVARFELGPLCQLLQTQTVEGLDELLARIESALDETVDLAESDRRLVALLEELSRFLRQNAPRELPFKVAFEKSEAVRTA